MNEGRSATWELTPPRLGTKSGWPPLSCLIPSPSHHSQGEPKRGRDRAGGEVVSIIVSRLPLWPGGGSSTQQLGSPVDRVSGPGGGRRIKDVMPQRERSCVSVHHHRHHHLHNNNNEIVTSIY